MPNYKPSYTLLVAALLFASLAGCSPRKESEEQGRSPEARDIRKSGADEAVNAAEKSVEKAEPSSQDEFFMAALNGDRETVATAIKSGTDVNSSDAGERTALMLAAYNGHTDVVAALLNANAEVNARDSMGRTALMFASTASNPETVTSLIDHGAGVGAVDSEEHWTALMFAAAEGCSEVVEILLQNGAAVKTTDLDGDTAADFARQRGHNELAARLEKNIEQE